MEMNSNKNISSSAERLTLAMEVATDGIWDWNIDTNETLFDQRYYTMAGYRERHGPGYAKADFLIPTLPPKVREKEPVWDYRLLTVS
jgi:PAS domain-containing protein